MGFRTVVILNNDMASNWVNDPQLGHKIGHASHFTQRIFMRIHKPLVLLMGWTLFL
jgi:hypothetical protein